MTRLQLFTRTALPLLLCAPGAALAAAQEAPAPAAQPPADTPAPAPAPAGDDEQGDTEVTFSADRLIYEEQGDTVTATGQVRMRREGYWLSADEVVWNRPSGQVQARGNVRVVSPEGDVAYGDNVELTDTLRDGVVSNLLLVLEDGGRLAATEARRDNGVTTLNRAAYSPCAVIGRDGCPQDPTWHITAVEVRHDPVRRRIYYRGATLNLFGTPIVPLPGLSHPDGSGESSGSGFLVPDLRFTRSNGVEIVAPYYMRLAPNRDITLTPHLYTDVLPMLEGHYRALNRLGAYQVRAYATHGSRLRPDPNNPPPLGFESGLRAHIDANGRFQLSPKWSVTGSLRYVTDRTFLRRYDISREDRLRSMVEAERITEDSYISLAGWAFQGLRLTDTQGQQPVALPAIDARWRFDSVWDGRIEVQANSLSILRTEGQDSRRAFASARWDRRSITPLGQELVLTAYGRADIYHANDTQLTGTAIYRGEEGWTPRLIGALAADLKWPLVGPFMGGTQRLTPRVQLVASPPTENLDIPNEDARSVDLEDSNLFALNRFPGYDRWEDGVRITYGADWAVDLPGITIRSNIGQSYRLNNRSTLLPPGTGLSDRFSDIVGRTNLRIGRNIAFTHRFRLDKDSLAVRRNEIDASFGGRRSYASVGYLRLDRNVDPAIEDLRDREEVRFGGRVQVTRHWSLFGSAVIDLTSSEEDPLSTTDGFSPVRHRLGILYNDDCIELGITWRRDYETTFDVERGNTFLFRVALRNLGR
jgi:LPS-assembly protein